MAGAVTVGRGRPANAPTVQRVARAAWHAAYDHLLGAGTVQQRVASWFDPDRLAEDDLLPDERPFLVAVDDRLVGVAEAVPRDGNYHLHRPYVHPDRWREGIGSRLLEGVTAAVRGRGADRLTVSVVDGGPAVAFYGESGLERVGEGYDDAFDLPRYDYVLELSAVPPSSTDR